ncbi:glycosyltransferase [Methylobacterium brachythecii]|uniref:Glycosyltransferase involved in cell wall biosynthesis n=1 Tax=Methylobacterium brachythecii TaxID=1176177 RepID=A0A7W6AMX5_9HYPH|nr:glycosyltransferase [Methylobacterium brachythecii]MBB3905561.1 glycosyltransferase involved in cell wall biosynthesis [Methylobacterium brachythecii]
MPIVSFIVTFYQQRPFIERAIRSALDQNFDGIEVIAVDDGSTDGSSTLVSNIDDPRLKLIVQDNRGPSLAANAGIEAASGEYIALLGGDDVALPDRISRQHDLVSRGYTDIAFDVPLLIDENGLPLSNAAYPAFSRREGGQNLQVSLDVLFFDKNFLCAPSAFMRKSTFSEVGPFNPGLIQLQDFEYWIRCLKKGFRLDVICDGLTAYRRLTKSRNLSSEVYMNRILFEEDYIMRRFFDDLDMPSLRKHFGKYIPFQFGDSFGETALAKALIYLYHRHYAVSNMAFEILIDILKDDAQTRETATSVGLTMPVIFNEMLSLRRNAD